MILRRLRSTALRRGLIGQFALILIIVLTQLPAVAGTATSSTPETRAPGITLDTPVEPAVITEQSEVRLSVRVTAGSTALPADTAVRFGVLPNLLTSRYAVGRWAGMRGTGSQGTRVAQTTLGKDLDAGQSTVVHLSVSPGGLPMTASDPWGPRAATLVLSGEQGTVAVARTHLVWGEPAPEDRRTLVSVVIPLVSDPADPQTGAMSRTTLARTTQPNGRLDAALAAADQPGTVLALDPLLLNEAVTPVDSDPAQATDEPTVEAAGRWIDRLTAVVDTHETLVLGYGDPDVAALVHADEPGLLDRGQRLGIEVAQAAVADQSRLRADIAFPADGTLDTATLESYQEIGRGTAVVVSESAMPTRRRQTMTATGRSELGSVPVLVSDDALSTTLGAVDDPDSSAVAIQRLRADGAALTREAPSRSRQILVVAPRMWSPTPDNARLAVQALTAVPWASPAALQSLIDADPGPTRVAPDLTADDREVELPAFGLHDVASTLTQTESLVTVLADPTGASRTAEAQAVALTSWQWRANLDGWRNARRTFARTPQDLRSAVHVVPGSPVTQVSRNVRLPVAIQNDASQTVRVVLDVTPRSSRLVVPNPVTVDVPPGSRAVGYVPVRGVGNGDTAVSVQLRLTNGVPLGEPTEIPVQVRADWETKGAWVFVGTAGVVLLVGLIRSVRRGTREARLNRDADPTNQGNNPVTDLDEDGAASPARRDSAPHRVGASRRATDEGGSTGAPQPAGDREAWQVSRETSTGDRTEDDR